jgi:hypothetical protein
MPDSSSWDVIFGAESDQVVLGVGFPDGRRHEAGFLDLATRIGPGYRFLHTRPPVALSPQDGRGPAYAGRWVEDIRQDRPHVLAVLGHHIGSVYAAAIAEGIAQWQPMPRLILFDPQFSSTDLVCLEFHQEISAMSPLLGDDEIERARKVVTEISRAASGDLVDVAAEMVESYLEQITAAWERAGLGDVRDNKFTRSFQSRISWLSAADRIDPTSAWKRSTGITSSAYAELLTGPVSAGGRRGLIGQLIPFDVSRADLLRSDSVARTVLNLLASR